MHIGEDQFDRWCARDCGFPRPDWNAVWRWVGDNVPADGRHDAACHAERLWLGRLAAHLGGGYRVAESERFLLLHEPAAADAEAFLPMAEATLADVEDALEGAADKGERMGKIPVLVFTEDDDFYDYVSQFTPEGHQGTASGMCLGDGEVHVALRCPEDQVRATLAHELGHACVTHLPLPLWVNEGVVEVVRRRVVDEDPPDFDAERRDRHYAHWSFHGLTGLWDGSAFSRPDELQHLSYELAEALVRRMNAGNEQAFEAFLLAATWEDAGEAAAKRHLGRSVVAYVAEVLGEGPWLPPAGSGE